MCGIAGGIALNPGARPDEQRVRRLSCLISHRGPDADGYWGAPSGRAAMAHRRLSIIDLAAGQQPMIDETGGLGLVFNGEIYNYKELGKTLAQRGHAFHTSSDTEVLLRAYERDGVECVNELRGMFAFAVWDDAKGRLLLARDRIGKKPLYYTVEDECLYFASSLHALRDTSPRRWAIDTAALDAFLTLGYIPAPHTIYEGVSKLEAGTTVVVDASGIRASRYWDLAGEPDAFTGTFTDAVDQLDELLGTAVRLRLRSDVPLGVFLSGGIDSSLVAAIAARQAEIPITTFSIGFDVAAFDESGFAAQVARQLGADHHVIHARPDLMRTLPSMVRHFGEPFADSSALPTWLLAEETRKHVTVALGGDGGDEAFAGYSWYHTAARLRRVARSVPEGVFAGASRSLDGILRPAASRYRVAAQAWRGMRMLGIADESERFASLRSFIGPHEVDTLYAGELLARRRNGHGSRNGAGAAADLLAGRYRNSMGSDLRRMRYVDVSTYLADCLMPKVDVATMAHALELRAPLLDQDVMRFALALPDEWLIEHGRGKKLLRTLLARYLPDSLFDRPKQGFSVPLTRWFNGSVRDVISALPKSERLRESGWLEPSGIQALVHEHNHGLRDNSQRLFSFLVLDEWLSQQ
jgi:asparagine synthase (glutamine-hydrolysing)